MTVTAAYDGRRVLVTGLTGFKGRWLGEWLHRLRAKVHGFALPPTTEMDTAWPDAGGRYPCTHADIRSLPEVQRCIDTQQPEIVFHLAAQPLVRLSYQQPIETFAANVMGVANVLEAARSCPSVKAVVVITTDKCYLNREWHWGYREDDPLGGHDPYSASKACAEIVTQCYRQSFASQRPNLLIASARAGNVIGGGDWALDRLVPDIIKTIGNGQPVHLRQPEAIRPWQHVLEPLSGYLMLGAQLLSGAALAASAWNFGPSDAVPLSVGEVASLVVERWGQGQIIAEQAYCGPHEAKFLKLDSSKAISELAWRPLLTNEQRIGWTVDWYKACHRSPALAWEQTHTQIEMFEAEIARRTNMAARWFGQQQPVRMAA